MFLNRYSPANCKGA